MKKTILATVLASTAMANAMAQENVVLNQKSVDLHKDSYSLIVKFKDEQVHKALLSTPETTAMLSKQKMAKASTASVSNLAAKYNVETTVSRSYGTTKLSNIGSQVGVKLEHVRSMSFNGDVVKVSDLDGRNIASVVAELEAREDLEYVMLNTMMYAQSFNDPLYENQRYFQAKTSTNPQGNNFAYSAENAVNNLGRKVRIGIIDSGILPHDDVPEHVEGYDFLSWKNGDLQHTRDSDPTDFVTYPDGTTCSSQHGLAVTSNAAAISNNGEGLAGVVKTGEVEIVHARVLDCVGGTTSDIMDAVAWQAGFSVPGVPDISEPVDVINMSLGGYSLTGCDATFSQDVFDKVREAGVTVLVAAGNDSDNAKNYVPASCNNVITVGATDDYRDDRASFSNFGEYVDVMAAGSMIVSAWNPEYPNKAGNMEDYYYYYASGTSMATPLTAGLVANLVMTHPTLTPDQIESMLRASSVEYREDSQCGSLGCGKGAVQADKATNAISQVTKISDYSKAHRYEGYNTPEQETWLTEMDQYTNTCNLVKYTWGNLGFAMEGVTYKLYSSENGGEMSLMETISLPQKVYNLPDNMEVGVQACQGGNCGEIVKMTGQVVVPNACL